MIADAVGYSSEGLLRLALTGVVGIVVARHLGPADLGLLVFVGSMFTLLAPLTRLGFPQLLLREFATNDRWRPPLSSAVLVQLPVAAITSMIALGVVASSRPGEREALLIGALLLPVPLAGVGESFRSLHQARGRVRQVVLTGIVAAVVVSATRLALVVVSAPLWMFAVAGTLEVAVVLVGYTCRLPDGVHLRELTRYFDSDSARRLTKEGWPLLLAGVAVTIYMKSDLVMLGLLSGDEQTGIYSAAARLSEMWYFVPVAVATAAAPRMSRMYGREEYARYSVATQRLMTTLVAGSLLVVVATSVLAGPVVNLLYGDAYSATIPVLRVHALAGPFVFAGVAASHVLVDRQLTRITFWRSVVGALVNVGLNLVLIPSMGALGASIATLVSYALSGVLLNLAAAATRPIGIQQARAFRLAWPKWPDDHDA